MFVSFGETIEPGETAPVGQNLWYVMSLSPPYALIVQSILMTFLCLVVGSPVMGLNH